MSYHQHTRKCDGMCDTCDCPESVRLPGDDIEVTDAMVDAYLRANDAYWREVDALPLPVGRWRNGTPKEATRVSLRAALAAAKGKP